MATNTYLQHYVIHCVAKTLKVYDMCTDYTNDVSLCIRVWKEIIRKKTIR